jgi:hypothetical protein
LCRVCETDGQGCMGRLQIAHIAKQDTVVQARQIKSNVHQGIKAIPAPVITCSNSTAWHMRSAAGAAEAVECRYAYARRSCQAIFYSKRQRVPRGQVPELNA